MNKLVNLVIIFLSLQYLIPLVQIQAIEGNILYKNIFTGLFIGLIQFIYNYGMKVSKRKDIDFKNNLIDSFFKMMLVLGGVYIYEDFRNTGIASEFQTNNFFRSLFITLIITFFILIKCLITP